jgi:exodeoxyribonuclease-3
LVACYTPNSGSGLHRLKYRTEEWDVAFFKYLKDLEIKNKTIILTGDLNVAHTEIDLKNPKTNLKTAGYTVEERDSFNKILTNCNLTDTFRKLNPEKIEYSFWSYMRKSREKNIGWRIDYFLTSKSLENKIKESLILTKIQGSDHAPIKLKI